MRLIILGQNGFIGSHLYNFIEKQNTELLGFKKHSLDFCKPETFSAYLPANEDIIVDCVAKIDGNENDINSVNKTGLKDFISYLNSCSIKFRYVYFSTYATCIPELVSSNIYARSKFLAEEIVRKNTVDYKIVRLIFPFGKSEGKNRLISRMINKIKSGEKISVDRLTLNLTPIADLQNHFFELINSAKKEINFSNGIEFYFPDIINFIFNQLSLKPDFVTTDKELKITVPSPLAALFSQDTVYSEIASMLHD